MLAVGCGSQVTAPTRGDDERAMAEKAKAAIVALAHANPKMFQGLDPDSLQAVPLKSGEEPHTYRLGAFKINVAERWYNADIGNDVWHQWYNGTFTVDAAGGGRVPKAGGNWVVKKRRFPILGAQLFTSKWDRGERRNADGQTVHEDRGVVHSRLGIFAG